MDHGTRILVGAVATTVLAGCAGGTRSTVAPPAVHPVVSDGVVNVGAVALHLHCIGDGAPPVVIDAGLGLGGAAWLDVQRAVAETTRTCVYDRAGIGYSSRPAELPHTNDTMARELHELLLRAGLVGPFVLVGHSMGGVNVRLYADQHPTEVAGMVLVDAMNSEQVERYWSLMPKTALDEFHEGLSHVSEGTTYETLASGLAKMQAESRSIGDLPLVVLTRGKEDGFPGITAEHAATMLRAWHDMQQELLHLSRNAVQVVAVNSHHNMQWDAPHLVAASIRETVRAVRAHGRVSTDTLAPLATEGPQ